MKRERSAIPWRQNFYFPRMKTDLTNPEGGAGCNEM